MSRHEKPSPSLIQLLYHPSSQPEVARLVRNILAIEPKALSPAIQNPVTILTTSPAVQKTIRTVLSEIKRQADARGYAEFSSAISHITGDTMPPWPQLRDILNSFEDKAYGSFGEYVRASAGLNEIPFELRATCDIIRPSLAPNSSIIRTKLVESFNDVLDITPSLVPSRTIGQWARCARRQSNQLSSQTGTLGNCSEAEVLMRFDGGALPYNVCHVGRNKGPDLGNGATSNTNCAYMVWKDGVFDGKALEGPHAMSGPMSGHV
ncbi:hypothetical protein B0H13DRAFT_1874638 [Mycena leptocephala]|nr:hypothetical protein B0H13DRAFT_1874638 [Mycena leptocephala]